MGNNFRAEIHNRTINDITKIEVSSDQTNKIIPFNINSISAGNSYDIHLIKGKTIGEKILMGTARVLTPWSTFVPPQYKFNITTTFRNGAQDSFTIFLESSDNSFIKMEKQIETHHISIQPTQDNEKVTITFENTEKQIENHEAQILHEQANVLISELKFSEASNKLDEALQKANETQTVTTILTCISHLENAIDAMDQKAKRMCDEGLKMLSENNYEEASDKFEHSLKFAQKHETISSIRSNVTITQIMKRCQEKSEKQVSEAENLLSQDKYEEALKLLEEALMSAKKKETILAITRNMNKVNEITRSQAKSEEIVKEAESLLGSHLYDEALKTFEAALSFAKKKQTVQHIENNINKAHTYKINEQKAEEMKKEAETLFSQRKYEETLHLLEEALILAKKKETIFAITKNMKQVNEITRSQAKSEEIVKEAESLLSSHSYEEALKKFETALTFAKKKQTVQVIEDNINKTRKLNINERKAEEIKKEAETLLSQHKYEEALPLLEQALLLAKRKETIFAITKNMKKVKVITRSQAKSEEIIKEAESQLGSHSYEEALKKFEEALSFAKNKQTVQVIENNLNKARTLKTNEHKAEEMKKEAETLLNQHKYEEALNLLGEARIFAEKKETIFAITRNMQQVKEITRSQAKSEEIVKEAEWLLSNHLYEEALKKFKTALTFAKKKQTVQVIENNIDKARSLKIDEHKADEMKKEAETLLSEDKYEEALKLLKEAKIYAKKKETILAITTNMNKVKKIRKNQEKSEEIVKEAESLLSSHLYEEALKKFEEALNFAKKKETVQAIENSINKTRTLKINEHKAEEMKKEADALLDTHQYNKALKKFHQTLKYTQKDTTLIKERINQVHIMKKKEQKAQDLNEQGQNLLNDHRYDQALQKFDEALKSSINPDTINLIKSNKTKTQQEKDNLGKAVKLNEEGLLLKHSQAVKKFNQALKFANEETLINTIKMNKARALNEQGETSWTEAWNAEESSEDRSLEATQKLGQAKNLFMQANETFPSTKYEENIKLVDAKIQGNRYYNAGVKLEREGALLIEKMESSSACKEAVSKYTSVRENYTNAMNKFREGMKINEEKFKFRVGVVHEALDGVVKILDELEKCNLGYAVAEIKSEAVKKLINNVTD